ncbi:MAG: hypothetical protein ACLFNM_02260 [Candidatus Woesearchaeota archaeon]
MSLEQYISQHDKQRLCKKAKRLDCIDAVLGPFSSLCYMSGSDFLFSVGVATSIAELTFLKIPFMINYISKTKDYASLVYLGPKEIVANCSIAGGFLDIVPAYALRVNYALNKK